MAKNFVQNGDVITCVAPAGGVVSGGAYLIGALHVVATHSAAAGANFEGATSGVFTLTKVQADAPAQGAKAYLKADGTVSVSPTSATLIGTFMKAYANGDTKADVRLSGVPV